MKASEPTRPFYQAAARSGTPSATASYTIALLREHGELAAADWLTELTLPADREPGAGAHVAVPLAPVPGSGPGHAANGDPRLQRGPAEPAPWIGLGCESGAPAHAVVCVLLLASANEDDTALFLGLILATAAIGGVVAITLVSLPRK